MSAIPDNVGAFLEQAKADGRHFDRLERLRRKFAAAAEHLQLPNADAYFEPANLKDRDEFLVGLVDRMIDPLLARLGVEIPED